MLIQPVQMGEALLEDIAAARPDGGLAAWWLGQSGFLVKCDQAAVLFDPYLSDSLTQKYADTDKPHERMTELVVSPGDLCGIDLITSSHIHTDHLDAETLLPLFAGNPSAEFLIPEANRDFVVDRLGCDPAFPVGMSDGETLGVGPFTVYAVPAAHNQIDRDERGRCKYLGYVVQCGGMTVYHSGDTLRYDGMADRLRELNIDLAILPINGNRPERRVAGNLLGDEAAQLAHDVNARCVVPCHYEMFRFNTETPDLFTETCRRLGQAHRVARCGERIELPPATRERRGEQRCAN